MKVACPGCAKSLNLRDELAGRRVRCPACQEVFSVPQSAPVSAERPVKPRPAKSAEAPPVAVTDSLKPRQPARAPSRRPEPDDTEEGRCYIEIHRDRVGLALEVEDRLEKLIKTERLDLRIAGEDELLPDNLRPNDLVIEGEVTQCDYGSQALRYFVGIVSLFGPGSSQLAVDVQVETGDGETQRIQSHARQAIGLFGGSNDGMMKVNVKVLAKRIATGAARLATGNPFLNAQAYGCAYWSLGLGLASLIPCLGVLLGLAGIVAGIVALVTISRRRLPRGKGAAITGIVLAFLGFAVTVVTGILMTTF